MKDLHSPLHGKAKQEGKWIYCEDGSIHEAEFNAWRFDEAEGYCIIQGCTERTKDPICTIHATQIRKSLDIDVGTPTKLERMADVSEEMQRIKDACSKTRAASQRAEQW